MFQLDERFRRRLLHGALVHRARSMHGAIEIREDAEFRWFTVGGRIVQSLMRKACAHDIVLPNQLAMLAGLLWRARAPTRVLNLGFGSGAFERFFHAKMPKCERVSVEIDTTLVDSARRYFEIPADWPVLIEDAAEYLARSTLRFDLILCDIFAGECHPDCLFDPYFQRDAARRLRPAGVLAVNVSPTAEDDLSAILTAMRQSFEWVVVAPVPDHGNVIVFAAHNESPDDNQLALRAMAFTRKTGADLRPFLTALERLPARSRVMGRRPR